MNYYFPEGVPKDGQELYRAPEATELVIDLKTTQNLTEEFLRYAENYRRAAHRITEDVLESGNNEQRDKYILPIGFLYRNGIELIIKALAFKYDIDKQALISDNNHSIIGILGCVKGFIQKQINKDEDIFHWLQSFLANLEIFDKNSDLFRYPFKVKKIGSVYKQTYLFRERMNIDLLKFANKFEIAYGILESYSKEEPLDDDIYKNYNTDLFQSGSYVTTAIVGGSRFEYSYYTFSNAYIHCAVYLKNAILKEPMNKEIYFNPMCYLYRNAIELLLKKIIVEHGEEDIQVKLKNIERKNKHSVLGLWNKAYKSIEKFNTSLDAENDIKYAQKLIERIQTNDNKSDKYRYPINRKGVFFWDKQQTISINNHVGCFEAIINFLDSVDINIEIYNENQAERETNFIVS